MEPNQQITLPDLAFWRLNENAGVSLKRVFHTLHLVYTDDGLNQEGN